MARTGIESINALYELEQANWKTIPCGRDEVKCKCPIHGEDSDPSVALNTTKNLWVCHTCKRTGDIVSLLGHIALKRGVKGVTRAATIQELSRRYSLEDEKELPAESAENFHQFFLKTIEKGNALYDELRKRGITDQMIREARLGYYDGRITIPIYDQHGRLLNIRRYLPGAPKFKFKNQEGFGKTRLYQIKDAIDYSKVIICGGELKALLAKHLMNRHGYGAVSATAGEGSWEHEWNTYFKGKEVWICMDIDPAGHAAARRIAEQIYSSCKSVKIMSIPLDRNKYNKGDLSDYVGQEKATDADILKLLANARTYEPITVSVEIDKGDKVVNLANIADTTNIDYRLEFTGVVSAMDTTPYLLPREVWATCNRDQANCHLCPIKREDPDPESGFVKKIISPTARGLLETVGVGSSAQRDGIRASLGVPTCKAVQFEVRDYYSVVDARLSTQLEISNESSGVQQPAYIVNANVDLNLPYIFHGKVYPHPKNQQSVVIINELTETADSLARYSLTERDRELLRIFTCEPSVESITKKLEDIYDDLENNVTRILSRRDLHLVIDLTYHSALYIHYDSRTINGWINSLICGDSAQGKSESTSRLKQHYGLGERIECKNATSAGLVGGVQQLNGRWFITWGVIPVNDRRLVILEEIKGASVEVIGKLTDMRSSGVAEIPKIERRRAHARTRLAFISNPRESQPLSAFNFGIEALQNLIGSLEDIRRFDVATLLASEDIDMHNLVLKQNVPHKYTADICHKLVLFAWTLKPDEILLASGVVEALREAGLYFSDRFTEAFPLVDKGTIRHKILRLATALAIRLYSVNADNKLVVYPGHVAYIREWLDRMYSSSRFGYLEFTKAQQALNAIPDPDALRKFFNNTRHPKSLISGLLSKPEVNLYDIMDLAEVDRDVGSNMISFLVRNHCLRRQKLGYVKSPAFITLLKNSIGSAKETAGADDDF